MARRCIFCASQKDVTAEHVIGKWVIPLFAHLGTIGTNVIMHGPGLETTFTQPLFQQTVKKVCRKCNNGWMSNLEGRVRPFLGPMILESRQTELAPQVQHLFAKWAVKTAFVLQQLHPHHNVIPESEYARFYAIQQPMVGYCVWMGHRANLLDDGKGMPRIVASLEEVIHSIRLGEDTTEEHIRDLDAKGHRIYRVTFTIGHVVFQVLGHNYPGSFALTWNASPAHFLQQIWPVTERHSWPPPAPIDVMGGFEALHDVFKIPPQTVK